MALPGNADVIVVRGYWWDESTGRGVTQSGGRAATVTFEPVPLAGQDATRTPNLRDQAATGYLKTRTRAATVDTTTGYFAALLVASNDPDLDAYGGRRVTFSGETPFVIEVPYAAPTVTVDAAMASATGLAEGSTVKAVWLAEASLVTTPTPVPPVNYLTSTQTMSTVATAIEAHDADAAAHLDIRALIGTPYTDEQARDALASALTAGANITITPDDAGNTITISASMPVTYTDEAAQDALAALVTAGTHSGISFTYNDAGNTLSATVSAQSWSQITGKPTFAAVATSGSYTDLSNQPTIPAAYTDEQARDAVGAALVAGSNVTITVNDAADTITIASAGGGGGGTDTGTSSTIMSASNGSDDTTAISTAMDSANTAGKALFFPPGTYYCNTITKSYAPRIWAVPGTVTIVALNTSSYVWNFTGTLGSTVALTANAARNAWTITTGSTTGIAAGDLLVIGDQAAPYSTQSTRYQGQSVQVQSVDSSTQLTLTDAVYNLLTTASSAFYAKVTAPSGCRISGLRFRNTNASSTGGFLRFTYCRDINVQFDGEGSGGPGIRLEHCYNFQVDTFAKDYWDNGQTGLQQFGYGCEVAGASSHGDVHVRAQRVRHAVSGGGIDTFNGEPVNVRVTGVAHGCTGQSWDWHAQGCDIVFANCLSYASRGYGFALRGRRQHILGGSVSQGAGGVWMFEHPGENTIQGLRVTDVANTSSLDESGQGGHGILVNAPAPNVTIRNCEFLRIAQAGITLSGGGLTDGVIEGNQFRNLGLANVAGTKSGIRAISGLTRTRINRNIVEDNQGTPTTLYGFTFDAACTDTTLSANRVHNSITSLTGAGSGSVSVAPDTSALATVASTGAYTDLTGTPTLSTVATSGAYTDLTSKPTIPTDKLTPWLVGGALQANIPDRLGTGSFGFLASGRLYLAGLLVLDPGVTISSISFISGGTSAGTPTNWWFCLVDKNLNILGKTADQTTAAWGANAIKTLTLTTPYTPSVATPVYAGVNVTATTVPTLVGTAFSGSTIGNLSPLISATANTGLTDPTSLTSVGTLTGTTLNAMAYAHVS